VIDVPIDRRYIGFRLLPFTVLVTSEQLRRFAEAIGYVGPDIDLDLAPPTYLKVIEGEGNSSRAIVSALQIDLRRILHVEQEFEYHLPIRAGDRVTVERTVSDIHARKGGALEFVVVDSTLHNGDGTSFGRSRQTILVRNEPSHASP
jgi:hydroxyacyl-ACP dehydratase HTD2-like protein with hotdog domain